MVEFFNTFYWTMAQYAMGVVILLILAGINSWVGHKRDKSREMSFKKRFYAEACCNISIFIIAVLVYSLFA